MSNLPQSFWCWAGGHPFQPATWKERPPHFCGRPHFLDGHCHPGCTVTKLYHDRFPCPENPGERERQSLWPGADGNGMEQRRAATIKRPARNTRADAFIVIHSPLDPLYDEHNQDDAEDEHGEPSAGNTMEFSVSHLQAVVAHALQQLAKQANASLLDLTLVAFLFAVIT